MLETTALLATMPAHLGVPLTDFVAWAVVLAFLAAPAVSDTAKSATAKIIEIGGAKPRSAAASHLSDTARVEAISTPARVPAPTVITPAKSRLSTADQWRTVSRLVSGGADRAKAVARDQLSIRRELDALDLTIENMRRELATVMTMTVPAPRPSGQLIAIPVRARSAAIAA